MTLARHLLTARPTELTLSPVERFIAAVVHGRHQLEEQVGGLALERDAGHLVDHHERHSAEAPKLGFETSGAWAPPSRSTHCAAVANATRCPASHARMPSAIDRWLLPVPGDRRNTALGLASMKSRAPKWATTSARTLR